MSDVNVANRTLFEGDNLPVLQGLNDECIDLIATDPPFNKGRDFHATPDSLAAGAKFADRWRWEEDVHEEWVDAIKDDEPAAWSVIDWSRLSYGDDMGAFLCFIGVRLLEMRRVLKPTGSIYLHCDPTASHYLKALMDAVFGRRNFRNEIVWRKYAGRKNNAKRKFPTQHEQLLFYTKTDAATFTLPMLPHSEKEIEREYAYTDEDGRRYRKSRGRNYQLTGEERRLYLDESPGRGAGTLWVEDGLQLNTSSSERTGYPTQKPLALYDRIIRASSNEGDWVLDPFAGCATTPIAAELAGRKWIAIDLWEGAAGVLRDRLNRELKLGAGESMALFGDANHRTDAPVRTDEGGTAAPYLATPTRGERKPLMSNAEIKRRLLAEFGGQCWGCTFIAPATAHDPAAYLELDHVRPRSAGGPNDIHNRALLCGPCNKVKKHTLTLAGLRKANGVKAHPIDLKDAGSWAQRVYDEALFAAAQRGS